MNNSSSSSSSSAAPVRKVGIYVRSGTVREGESKADSLTAYAERMFPGEIVEPTVFRDRRTKADAGGPNRRALVAAGAQFDAVFFNTRWDTLVDGGEGTFEGLLDLVRSGALGLLVIGNDTYRTESLRRSSSDVAGELFDADPDEVIAAFELLTGSCRTGNFLAALGQLETALVSERRARVLGLD